jgi:hypothetical protein
MSGRLGIVPRFIKAPEAGEGNVCKKVFLLRLEILYPVCFVCFTKKSHDYLLDAGTGRGV